jgi:hypothetical protein
MSELEALPEQSENLELGLDRWAESLIMRHGRESLSLIPYDPANPYHSANFIKAEAINQTSKQALENGNRAIGTENFGPLFGDLKQLPDGSGHPYGAMRQIKSHLRVRNHNVAIITNHADLMDLPLAQTALLSAIEHDNLGYQSAIIVNRALTRLAYNGIPVVDTLRQNGAVYLNMPRTSSAAKYGISDADSISFNRKMGKQLAIDLRELNSDGKSMLLAVSLAGSTMDLSNGYIETPNIEPTTSKFVLSRFNFVLPMSFYLPNLTSSKDWYKLHQPQIVSTDEEINQLMELLVLDTVDMTNRNAVYDGRRYLGKMAINQDDSQ